MSHNEPIAVIEVRIVNDGGLITVDSKDVPGLHLAGTNKAKIEANIIPAIKRLFKDNRKLDVEVYPATNSDVFPDPAELLSDRYVMYGSKAA